jgi:penicillin V acylase-like amidase (Ntn superfamily)
MKTAFSMRLALTPVLLLALASHQSEACSRILYETGTGTYIVGRSMDWNDPTARTSLWVFPKGMQRDGGIGANPIKWTSKYGSVIASFYDAATVDGINEKGLVGNGLYLAESGYGDPAKTGKPTISIGAWCQYFLDNYATVKEAVEAMQDAPFTVVAPLLPNGRAATAHLSISDSSGDSAILEYLDGKLVIHHGPKFRVMTNSPTYDEQLALTAYWDQIGGKNMLPGTISAADRFVRLSYNLKASPKFKDRDMAVASVMSQMRAIGVPLGMADPDRPNISSTLWRTVIDHDAKRYYFESAILPAVFWVDLNKVDVKPGAKVKMIPIERGKPMAGEVSEHFKEAEPFKWLK